MAMQPPQQAPRWAYCCPTPRLAIALRRSSLPLSGVLRHNGFFFKDYEFYRLATHALRPLGDGSHRLHNIYAYSNMCAEASCCSNLRMIGRL